MDWCLSLRLRCSEGKKPVGGKTKGKCGFFHGCISLSSLVVTRQRTKKKGIVFYPKTRQRQRQAKASHFCHLLSRVSGQKRRNAFFRYLCFASDIKIIYISMPLVFILWCQGYHSVIITQITRYDAYIQISVAALVFFYYLSSV